MARSGSTERVVGEEDIAVRLDRADDLADLALQEVRERALRTQTDHQLEGDDLTVVGVDGVDQAPQEAHLVIRAQHLVPPERRRRERAIVGTRPALVTEVVRQVLGEQGGDGVEVHHGPSPASPDPGC